MNDAIVRLAEHHTLSLISARLLDAALATGRNVLCTGPLTACMPLMTALVAEADRPGFYSAHVYAPKGDAPLSAGSQSQAPKGDAAADSGAAEAPDRLAAWQPQPQAVAQALLHHVGVVGHLAAGRLDRCLMRLELALLHHAPSAPPGLAVLAAVDLVVVVTGGGQGTPQVEAIYELVMAEDGYRPAPLFALGTGAAAQMLVPVRPPTFTAALMAAGHGALAQELQAAAPAAGVHDPHVGRAESQPPGQAVGRDAPRGRESASYEPAHLGRRSPVAPPRGPERAKTSPARPVSSPGWELDQEEGLPAQEARGPDAAGSFAEHLAALNGPDSAAAGQHGLFGLDLPNPEDGSGATMTAQDQADADAPIGLEPPPKPRG